MTAEQGITGIVLWDDVPPEQRSDGSRYQGYSIPEHRGCRAAVQWPSDDFWHRCASIGSKQRGLCQKHAHRAGLGPLSSPRPSHHPRNLDTRTYNAIARELRRPYPDITVDDFRRVSDDEIAGFRNVGRLTAPTLQRVRDTWTDTELIQNLGLRPSPLDVGERVVCNWVGEGVPARAERYERLTA